MKQITVFWFRRDLRLKDNTGLYYALRDNENVLPLFIFDKAILDKLDDKNDARISFIFECLIGIQKELNELGSTILIKYGQPMDVFREIIKKHPLHKVYTNHDYEPYALQRDLQVEELLKEHNIQFQSYKDQCIFEKNEILTNQGKPYTVFTPYSKKWKATLTEKELKSYATEDYFQHLIKKEEIEPAVIPSLKEIGFLPQQGAFPPRLIKKKIIQDYAKNRDYPAIEGTTRLGVHLRFGTLSIRSLVKIAKNLDERYLNELIWRDFYMMILYHFPHVVTEAFRPAYDLIQWRNSEVEFQAWFEGKTGYPIVDAGMRELNNTGYMHNRVRMITASFLTKHLLIDWRWGEAYFAKKLLDYDLSANNGGWQWAASSGCDAAPYFRIFNPGSQIQKFDKELEYTKKWIPELDSSKYPKPIVEHKFARERALVTYKKALNPNNE